MLPIELLEANLPKDAPAGSLLLPFGDSGEVVQLRFDGEAKLAVRLGPEHSRAFVGINVERAHVPALALKDWSLRVDPTSAYSAFDSSPASGHIFTCDLGRKTGLVISLDQSTCYVTLDGELIREPDFGAEKYVGFRAWAIGRDVGDRFIELVTVDHRATGDA